MPFRVRTSQDCSRDSAKRPRSVARGSVAGRLSSYPGPIAARGRCAFGCLRSDRATINFSPRNRPRKATRLSANCRRPCLASDRLGTRRAAVSLPVENPLPPAPRLYWVKLQFPFWWTSVLTPLDALSRIGFTQHPERGAHAAPPSPERTTCSGEGGQGVRPGSSPANPQNQRSVCCVREVRRQNGRATKFRQFLS